MGKLKFDRAEGQLKVALCVVKMLESDLFRHRNMLDVTPVDAARVAYHAKAALAILEPSYRGHTFRVTDAVNFDERVLVKIPKGDPG